MCAVCPAFVVLKAYCKPFPCSLYITHVRVSSVYILHLALHPMQCAQVIMFPVYYHLCSVLPIVFCRRTLVSSYLLVRNWA